MSYSPVPTRSKTLTPVLVVAGVIGFIIAVTIWAVAGSWWSKGIEKSSADNVEQQYAEVISDYNAMQTAADNVCQAKTQLDKQKTTDKDSQVLEDPLLAYTATYRSDVQKYSDALDDVFRAKLVGPKGYPKSDAVKNVNTANWCTVSDQLRNLKQ